MLQELDSVSWETLVSSGPQLLADSRCSVRIPALQALQAHLALKPEAGATKPALDVLARAVLQTYCHYQDSRSRAEVLATLRAYLAWNSAYLPIFATYIHRVGSHAGNLAPTDTLTLLTWAGMVVNAAANESAAQKTAVQALALLLDFGCSFTAMKASAHSRRMHASFLVQLRTLLVEALASGALPAAQAIGYALDLPHSAGLAYLASLALALHDLLPAQPALYDSVNQDLAQKKQVLEFWVAGILAKTPVVVFSGFVENYVSEFVSDADYWEIVQPAVDKTVMRNSELGFANVVVPIFSSVPAPNISSVFAGSKLLTHIINGLKSSKETVREYASTTLASIFAHSVPSISTKDLSSVIDELLKAYKSTSNADTKALLVASLANIPPLESVTPHLIALLAPLAQKETGDKPLSELASVLVAHVSEAIIRDWNSAAGATFTSGLANPKAQLRRVWAEKLGDYTYKHSLNIDEKLVKFLRTLLPALRKTFDEVVKLPLLAITNSTIICAYVYVYLSMVCEDDFENVQKIALQDSADKFSILVSPNILAKLSGSEQLWGLRALLVVSGAAEEKFGSALLHFCISSGVSSSVRREGLEGVKKLISQDPEVYGSKLIAALDRVLVSEEKDVSLKYAAPLINAIVLVEDKAIARKLLGCFVVIAHHPSITVKEGWIGAALRTGVDPGEIVKDDHDTLLATIDDVIDRTSPDSAYYQAACESLATLEFLSPEVVADKLSHVFNRDLDAAKLDEIDDLAIQIWQSDGTEPVIDVLNAKSSKDLQDKNSKDYETRKWEESLKQQIAEKRKNQPKKLTREEQALVTEQLAKESEIRISVSKTVSSLTRGFHIFAALTRSKFVVASLERCKWFITAILSSLKVLQHSKAHLILGSLGVRTFMGASALATPRLGVLRELTAIATLRAYNVEGIPEDFREQELLGLISRVLFRTKILSDDSYDLLSFVYVFPLLIRALEVGKNVAIKNSSKQVVTSEFVDEDPEDEHLSLAMDIISSQSFLENAVIPRQKVLTLLLELMGISSKAKSAKDCFLTVCQQISVLPQPADLALLLRSLITPDKFVKLAILQGLDSEFDLQDEMNYSDEIWICRFDVDANIADLAATVWYDNLFELVEDTQSRLIEFAPIADSGMRLTVARAIAAAVEVLEGSFPATLDLILAKYKEKENPPPAPVDRFGIVLNDPKYQKDPWEYRLTIALTLKLLSGYFTDRAAVEKLFNFLVKDKALGDKEYLVGQELLDAGNEVVKQHGLQHVETLIPFFEAALAEKDENTSSQDSIKERVIILYGSLGRHLGAGDHRLLIVVDRLLATLETPSEDVQYAVSECIAPLVKNMEPRVQELIDQLFDKLWNATNLAVRKGAAYGIAGIVKGAGIKSLFANDVMRNLNTAADEKKAEMREGVALVFDCLSQSLGSFFEPYVVDILPILLKFLGDSSPKVREATDVAARQIMKSTTSYGVKKLIPLTISNLDDTAWRSKKGAVELLGSMAYLDPAQLSASLSLIVPEIVGVLNDTHKEVRKAADQALKRFGEVIRNPEIQAVVPALVAAIGDPTKYTEEALDSLIKTQFVHYIDGPSLALIIHVIHRGMRDRLAATKKKACQIVGNMAILVDANDLRPYLNSLVSELDLAMVDPVPGTRSTAARALGSLVERLGEEQFPDLIPRLLATLADPNRAGDRLGSAQALAEVISGLGLSKLDEMLPVILERAQSPQLHVRAGYMPLLLFLPVCFGSQFAPYLSSIIPAILSGLADTDEEIRDNALRSGRLIVKNYASKAVDLLLPELEKGLADLSYRIRLSSVELTGDLLFQVTGISGKNELTEDQTDVTKSLVTVLGQERRDRVLAALFVARSDSASTVRAAAIDIWKALVANTPRTVKEIVPSLTTLIIKRLASSDDSHRTTAASTLGEIVRRVGSSAMGQLLPALEEALQSLDGDSKQGICIALTELATSASDEVLSRYQSTFISITKEALADPAENVREAAATTFEAVQDRLPVVEQVVPALLEDLDKSDTAILALRDILATNANGIFPVLLPSLLGPPVNVSALAALASVAGPALYSRLGSILNSLVNEMKTLDSDEAAGAAFDQILLSVEDDAGVHPVMTQIMTLIKHQDLAVRVAVSSRLGSFFAQTKLDISVYVVDLVSNFILALGDKFLAPSVLDALTALVKAQDKPMLEKLVKPAHQALGMSGVKNSILPGFALPKGPGSILPIFSHGLMYGLSEQRELSALSIAEIVERTPAENLRPVSTIITGPLIRVIGERVTSDIKLAILVALTKLLVKIPQFLRPFVPQLQRTFVRCLLDASNEKLREGAVVALGALVEFTPRVDLLITELVSLAKSLEPAVKRTMLKAMLQVVAGGGQNMSEALKQAVVSLVEEEISSVDDKSAVAYAKLLGLLSLILLSEEASNILKLKVLVKGNLRFASLSINSFLRDLPEHVFNTGHLEEVAAFIEQCADNETPYVSDNGVVAIGKLLLLDGETKSPHLAKTANDNVDSFEVPAEIVANLVEKLAKAAVAPQSNSSDTRRLALVVVRTVARLKFALMKQHINILAPAVFLCLRDAIIPIRLAAEKAFLAIFQLIEEPDMTFFNEWFTEASKSEIRNIDDSVIQPRSIGDYAKRVGSRLAGVERERLEAGGDAETMFSDRYEDEAEVWAVGGV